MTTNWEDLLQYTGPIRGRKSTKPIFRLSRGYIAFNDYFIKKCLSGEKNVSFFYSIDKKAIVFNFHNNEKDGYELYTSRGKLKVIYVIGFFKKFSIELKSQSYIPELINIPEIGERWVVFLK